MRARLPSYMAPAYLEQLPFIPTLVSNKADRARLPKPKSERLRFTEAVVAPETATERLLCQALCETLGLEAVSVDGDFFAEYGAHSLLMARFCARARALDAALQIAMRDVYANTTVRKLARVVDAARPAAIEHLETPAEFHPVRFRLLRLRRRADGRLRRARRRGGRCWPGGLRLDLRGRRDPGHALQPRLDRRGALVLRPQRPRNRRQMAADRARARRRDSVVERGLFPLLGGQADRAVAPANAFTGTPLYNLFLRLLGAKIGRNAVIVSRVMPVTADLLEVGADAVIMRSAFVPGYSAFGNRIWLGAIRIGRGAYVGEQSVVDIGASIGDFGQLGHASSLQTGQRVPDGKRYAGSPAEETTTNFRLVDEAATSTLRRVVFTTVRLTFVLAIAGALTEAVIVYVMALLTDADDAMALGPWDATFAALPIAAMGALVVSLLALVGLLAAIYVVPRIANAFLVEGRVYPLYGFHHGMQQIVQTMGNSAFFNLMFGDSVFIEPYLRWVGWRLGVGDQTGSNFGSEQGQDNPFLCSVGANTVASDSLWLGNLTMSSHAFRLGQCRIGERNFLGTMVYVPPGARTGDNVLFGTKVMAPIDGPVRENVGLLGSPAFEIPRAASRDLEMLAAVSPRERARRLRRKTWLNVASILGLLASRWFIVFLTIYVFAWTAAVFGSNSIPEMIVAAGVVFALSIVVFILIERASLGFGSLKPEIATVYDPAFWRVERHWKLAGTRRSRPASPERRCATSSRACWASRSGARCSTTAPFSPSARWWRSATGRTSTSTASFRRIRSRRACSSPTSCGSAPIARSAWGRSSTTA